MVGGREGSERSQARAAARALTPYDVPREMLAALPPMDTLAPATAIDCRDFSPTSTPTVAPKRPPPLQGRAPEMDFSGAPAPGARPVARPTADGTAWIEPLRASLAAPPVELEMPRAATQRPPETPPLTVAEARPRTPIMRPGTVEAVTSVARGTPPEPGIQVSPYVWGNLLEGLPPPRPRSGEGVYAVYHVIEVDQDLRIVYQTLLSVRSDASRGAASEPRILVDARIIVSKRALLEQMDQARRNADQYAHRSTEALARRLARRRAGVVGWPTWATPLGFGLIRAQARMGHARIRGVRNLRKGMVEVPDALISSALRVQYHTTDRLARRSLIQAIRNPSTMNQEQRSVTLFLTGFFVGLLVLLLNSFFALAAPEHANLYRNLLLSASAQFVGMFVGFPPVEPVLASYTVTIGPFLAFSSVFTGRLLGAWVIYLLGDSLRHHLEKKTKSPRSKRLVAWLQMNAQKYGLAVLVLINAVPFAPEQLTLVLVVGGIRFRTWMVGIGVGTAIKFIAVIVFTMLVGPEKVVHFFENPFGIFG